MTQEFRDDVMALPTDSNQVAPFRKFADKYGTHYFSKIVMGAKAVVQSQVRLKSFGAIQIIPG